MMSFVVLVILIGVGFHAVTEYNALVAARGTYRNAFAQIDVQLTRRYDLVPTMIATAGRFLAHERDTLDAVLAARDVAAAALATAKANPGAVGAMQQLSRADASLSQVLARLLAVADAFPDLKADRAMMQAGEELTSTDSKVALARQTFNEAVLAYQQRRQTVSGSFIALMFALQPAEPLKSEWEPRRDEPALAVP